MPGKRLSGVKVPHNKNTADIKPERLEPPKTVVIPLSMHIGAPAVPLVKPGDAVKVGQPIASAAGFVSAPVHSSVSGKVKRFDDVLLSTGKYSKAVVIESDGQQELWEEIHPPEVNDLASFLKAVGDSGVVGLGGAGFPTAAKLTVKDLSLIEAIIVNGAECEPYVTSDTRTMIDNTDLVWEGICLMQKYMKAGRVIIAIEGNKPQCIAKFRELCSTASGVEVKELPPTYPQGGEKVLIYNTLGHIVPEGKLPIDVGAIVINCTTMAALTRYIKTGMPLIEKCVTVDGSAVASPKNVIAPIGTPISELFSFCGGFKTEPKKIILGGPMMGFAAPNTDIPVMKNTNAILALNEKDARLPKTTACIRCGRCVNTCPLGLMPAEIEVAYEKRDGARLDKLKVNLCMECGCCAYVCPAKRPLVQINKLAKTVLATYKAEQKAEAERKAQKKGDEGK